MYNNRISEKINSAEDLLKQPVETFFLSFYPANHLVSHGLGHHRRVWEYAKELLLNAAIPTEIIDKELIFNIITACYFHDIGMSADPGKRHGALGRKLCTEFLNSCNLSITGFKDALEAIEYHDDKDYLSHPEDNYVLDILSVADDIDAFGTIGIYRYSEIYLKRRISIRDIGWMIIKNAESRFENLEKRIKLSPEFKMKHRNRYNYLLDFFREYNAQLNSYDFCTPSPTGYCGIIQILANYDIREFSNIPDKYSKDPFITDFFINLSSENEFI
ncbi:MAG: hypothetical protein A2X05_05720 [Bacteroidetes bacterium GWE2_41_25]|nr:MAG: hypothetical protein A2X05_05720 [Bacteroidetes bacterium GWE2_41_25]